MRRGALLAVLIPAIAAARAEITVEGGPGVAVPFNQFFSLKSKDGDSIFSARNKVGPSFVVSVLLNDVELRWASNMYRIGNIRYGQDLDTAANAIDEVIAKAESAGVCDVLACGAVDNTYELPESGFLFVNHLTAGYRFYLHKGRWRPYLPLGAGSVVVAGDDVIPRMLFGLGLSLGFGSEWQIKDRWFFFGSLRYYAAIIEAPTALALSGLVQNAEAFDSALIFFHNLGVNLGVLARW